MNRYYNLLLSPRMLKTIAVGNIGGCIGETSAVLLLAGAIFLLYRRIITWHIPCSFIAAVAVCTGAYYAVKGSPGASSIPFFELRMVAFHVFSGGVFLGAFFMATDMVTSPVTRRGMILFGAGCGHLDAGSARLFAATGVAGRLGARAGALGAARL